MNEPKQDWGFPEFARDFPRDPELDRIVAAFAAGNFRAVRDGVPKLAAGTSDEAVRTAALTLLDRTRPDPASRVVLLATAALLAVLSAWWIGHDGPPADAADTRTAPAPPGAK
jgi:hypothetical protein